MVSRIEFASESSLHELVISGNAAAVTTQVNLSFSFVSH